MDSSSTCKQVDGICLVQFISKEWMAESEPGYRCVHGRLEGASSRIFFIWGQFNLRVRGHFMDLPLTVQRNPELFVDGL